MNEARISRDEAHGNIANDNAKPESTERAKCPNIEAALEVIREYGGSGSSFSAGTIEAMGSIATHFQPGALDPGLWECLMRVHRRAGVVREEQIPPTQRSAQLVAPPSTPVTVHVEDAADPRIDLPEIGESEVPALAKLDGLQRGFVDCAVSYIDRATDVRLPYDTWVALTGACAAMLLGYESLRAGGGA